MSTTGVSGEAEKELEAVFKESSDPVLTAVEVAEVLGVTQQAAHAKLSRAHEEGLVSRKKTGARSVVWWLSNQQSDAE